MNDEIEEGKKEALYGAIIQRIFDRHYRRGVSQFSFTRDEIEEIATELFKAGKTKKSKAKNLGDVVYAYRHRRPLPAKVLATQPKGLAWLILGEGDAKYRCVLSKLTHIRPTPGRTVIAVPDATPEIIVKYAQDDEQALLAKIRYNRLIDTFLGITVYSMQNHLRTKIPNYGQIEIDELYTGIDKEGRHYVVPVQAKGPKDILGAIQTIQDVTFCRTPPTKKGRPDFSKIECRPVSAQLLKDQGKETIVMFEMRFDGDEVSMVEERHYRLVDAATAESSPRKR